MSRFPFFYVARTFLSAKRSDTVKKSVFLVAANRRENKLAFFLKNRQKQGNSLCFIGPKGAVLRRFKSSDIDQVWELHRLAYKGSGADAGPGPWDQDFQNIPEVYFKGGTFLVLEFEGNIIAMGALKKIDAQTCEAKRMRVHPDFQRQGIGSLLLKTLEETGRKLGYGHIILDTSARLKASQTFYQKHGYTLYDKGKMGSQDLLFYEKSLPQEKTKSIDNLWTINRNDAVLPDPS